MKMTKTIAIVALFLAANLLLGAEFVLGELSLSAAGETYGGACCTDDGQDTCAGTCSVQGNNKTCEGTDSGSDTCQTRGVGACGDCFDPDDANLDGMCPD